MNRKLILSVLLLLSSAVLADEKRHYTPLKNGITMLDLNGDGLKDIVINASFDNRTSHPNNTMTIFMQSKSGEYNIVPVPNDVGFTWSDFSLSASTTKISDYRLYKKNDGYFVVSASKFASKSGGEDVTDKLSVKLSRYDIQINHEDPGVSLFYWNLTKTVVTKEHYNNADEAYTHANLSLLK